MRFLLLWVVVGLLVGCEPEGPLGKCDCHGPEEVRLVGTVDGALTTIDTGATFILEPVTRGCGRKTNLSLRNSGRVSLTVRATVDSPNIVLLNAPTVLRAGQSASLELLARSDEPMSFIETELTIASAGNLPLQRFTLRAQVNEPDAELSRTIDFGGVQLGARRSLSGSLVRGLSGDFQMTGAGVEFAPSGVGRQQLEATYDSLLDCPSLNKVTVVGDGVPAVLTGPATIDFGGVAVGSSADLDVDLRNYSFVGFRAELSTVGSPNYAVVIEPISPSASRSSTGALVPATSQLRVRFSPSSQGAVLQELAVISGAHTLLIPVRGTGR